MSEKQTCPRRMNEMGPWEYKENLDHWITDRWTTDHDAAEAKRQEFRDNNPNGSISATADEWLWSWGPPRTCDFCGGIHPEDAIRLVQDGWEVGGTGKAYKRYLNPPGTRQRHNAAMRSVGEGDAGFSRVPSVWTPGPPVKLYVMHFSDEQIEQFNLAADSK